MKKIIVVAAMALALAGCSSYSRTDRALGGAAIGATSGAVIGNLAGGTGGSTVAGALIGGVAGAIVGAETTPKACWARDSRGNRYRVQCP
ncbi:MAG: glycine zipper domain-containing protein [Labrys sp. (in: a-proteobacteria)]